MAADRGATSPIDAVASNGTCDPRPSPPVTPLAYPSANAKGHRARAGGAPARLEAAAAPLDPAGGISRALPLRPERRRPGPDRPALGSPGRVGGGRPRAPGRTHAPATRPPPRRAADDHRRRALLLVRARLDPDRAVPGQPVVAGGGMG